jgi:hypothetical protein
MSQVSHRCAIWTQPTFKEYLRNISKDPLQPYLVKSHNFTTPDTFSTTLSLSWCQWGDSNPCSLWFMSQVSYHCAIWTQPTFKEYLTTESKDLLQPYLVKSHNFSPHNFSLLFSLPLQWWDLNPLSYEHELSVLLLCTLWYSHPKTDCKKFLWNTLYIFFSFFFNFPLTHIPEEEGFALTRPVLDRFVLFSKMIYLWNRKK